jgi:hypothetical protein
MAEAYSTRRKAESFARRSKRDVVRASVFRTRSSAGGPQRLIRRTSNTSPIAAATALLPQLRDVALRLQVVYSTCVTAQLALEGQHAERDRDIARCLRMGVSEPVTKEVERIGAIIAEVGGATHESFP